MRKVEGRTREWGGGSRYERYPSQCGSCAWAPRATGRPVPRTRHRTSSTTCRSSSSWTGRPPSVHASGLSLFPVEPLTPDPGDGPYPKVSRGRDDTSTLQQTPSISPRLGVGPPRRDVGGRPQAPQGSEGLETQDGPCRPLVEDDPGPNPCPERKPESPLHLVWTGDLRVSDGRHN